MQGNLDFVAFLAAQTEFASCYRDTTYDGPQQLEEGKAAEFHHMLKTHCTPE
ncbi:hypothetical protein DPMN_026255 [Dreissena polymorpha]|uniref:Uncharacterized protein n=1 Tax=Dreissena polymorpha TaxID=45954 RepID=A0A9D4DLX2_DREPO|nr:hypothetical protein DPMN_185907 [Dreissena polymorpha]KAH3863274.1 hypothetical protein DPMN_026255 [Dreissena polymorpha]